jgi:hypothetical protein
MSLAPIDTSDVARWAAILVPASQLSERIADTDFVPKAIRGNPAAVTAVIMYGDEIGVGPMQALTGIHFVEGRPGPSAELMRAMILRAGHTLTVHEMSGTRARVSGLRAGDPESARVVIEWNLDMARAAGLLGKVNWQRYPRAMLLARATGDLSRLVFPDVIKGLGYVAEVAESVDELDSWQAGADPLDERPAIAPPRVPVQRRTSPRATSLPFPPKRPPLIATEDRPGPDGSVDVPLPDPAPELLEPEPVEDDTRELPPMPIAQAPLTALHAKLYKVTSGGISRDERMALIATMIGHPIASTSDLTREEGYAVLGELDKLDSGEATWSVNDDGSVTIEHYLPGGGPS